MEVYRFSFSEQFNVVATSEQDAKRLAKDWFIELLKEDFFTNQDFHLLDSYSLDGLKESAL